MSELTGDTSVRPCPGVVFRQVDEEAVLLDTRSGTYFGLNQTGALLWRVVEGGQATLEDLERAILATFGEAPATLRADLSSWARDLEAHDLLEIV